MIGFSMTELNNDKFMLVCILNIHQELPCPIFNTHG